MGQPQKLTLKTDSQPVSNSLQFTTALQHVYSGMLANHSGQSSLPNIEIGLWIKQVEIVFLLLPPVFYLNCKCHPTGQEVFQAHPDFTKGSKNICNQCQYKMCSIFIKNFMHDTHYIAAHHADTPAGAEHLKERFVPQNLWRKSLKQLFWRYPWHICMHVQ